MGCQTVDQGFAEWIGFDRNAAPNRVRNGHAIDLKPLLQCRVVRFGPPGWLTVVDHLTDDADVELYPMTRVLAVTHLREYGGAALRSSADH